MDNHRKDGKGALVRKKVIRISRFSNSEVKIVNWFDADNSFDLDDDEEEKTGVTDHREDSKTDDHRKVIPVKVYSDESMKIEKAWEEVKRKLNENIKDRSMFVGSLIMECIDRNIENLRAQERKFDVEIKEQVLRGTIIIKGIC